jgi:hypothetical protein
LALEESHVTSVLIAIFVAVLTFGSGILGLFFERRLPKEHMSGGSREMILAVIGLVTLLLALVLGTLVGNTYAFFATQKSELETYASRALLLDRALAHYGPEAKPIRDQLKAAMTESYQLFWEGRGDRSQAARGRGGRGSLRADCRFHCGAKSFDGGAEGCGRGRPISTSG